MCECARAAAVAESRIANAVLAVGAVARVGRVATTCDRTKYVRAKKVPVFLATYEVHSMLYDVIVQTHYTPQSIRDARG